MSVTRVREKWAITISQKDYTEDVAQPFRMEGCNTAYHREVELELSLNQPEKTLLNEVEKRCYRVITGAVHVFRTSHPIRYPLRSQSASEGHPHARKSSSEGGGAPASLLSRVYGLLYRQQAGRLQGCFLFGCLLGQHPRQRLAYLVIHRDVGQHPDQLQGGTAGLTAQSSMEAEIVREALAMKEEAVFCSNMMLELGYDKSFGSVPLYIDNTLETVPTFLAQSISHGGIIFSCKNWRRARSASSTSSRARVSWRTWAPSTLANTVTTTSSSSSTSLRLRTPKAHHLPWGGHHLPALRILAYC